MILNVDVRCTPTGICQMFRPPTACNQNVGSTFLSCSLSALLATHFIAYFGGSISVFFVGNGENSTLPIYGLDVMQGFHFQFIAVSLTVYWVEPTQYGFRVGTNSPPGVGLTPSAKGELNTTIHLSPANSCS